MNYFLNPPLHRYDFYNQGNGYMMKYNTYLSTIYTFGKKIAKSIL